MRKYLPGTYRTFYGYEFQPFRNKGRDVCKFGAVVARKRNDGNGMNCLIVYEELDERR